MNKGGNHVAITVAGCKQPSVHFLCFTGEGSRGYSSTEFGALIVKLAGQSYDVDDVPSFGASNPVVLSWVAQ